MRCNGAKESCLYEFVHYAHICMHVCKQCVCVFICVYICACL